MGAHIRQVVTKRRHNVAREFWTQEALCHCHRRSAQRIAQAAPIDPATFGSGRECLLCFCRKQSWLPPLEHNLLRVSMCQLVCNLSERVEIEDVESVLHELVKILYALSLYKLVRHHVRRLRRRFHRQAFNRFHRDSSCRLTLPVAGHRGSNPAWTKHHVNNRCEK